MSRRFDPQMEEAVSRIEEIFIRSGMDMFHTLWFIYTQRWVSSLELPDEVLSERPHTDFLDNHWHHIDLDGPSNEQARLYRFIEKMIKNTIKTHERIKMNHTLVLLMKAMWTKIRALTEEEKISMAELCGIGDPSIYGTADRASFLVLKRLEVSVFPACRGQQFSKDFGKLMEYAQTVTKLVSVFGFGVIGMISRETNRR